jgi:4-hydroxybenzoate polyprenyltransferase
MSDIIILDMSIKPYIKMLRLSHVYKQLFLIPGIICALAFLDQPFEIQFLPGIFWAFLATWLVACANYLMNEWLDRGTDKYHPEKSRRPAVTEKIQGRLVAKVFFSLLALGFLFGYLSSLNTFWTILMFSGMGILYNLEPIRLKDRPILDFLSESLNMVFRFLIGWFAVAGNVLPPVFLLILVWLVGLFLAILKRYLEYREIGDVKLAGQYRKSFKFYTSRNLLVLTIVFGFLSLVSGFTALRIIQGIIPTSAVRGNMESSLEILDEHGAFPKIVKMPEFMRMHDFGVVENFGNMWMVQAMESDRYFDEAELYEGRAYNSANRDLADENKLARIFSTGWKEGNYWNGYLIFLKPAMIIFDIAGVFVLLILILAAAVTWLFIWMRKYIGKVESIFLLLAILLTLPINNLLMLDALPDLIQAVFSSVLVIYMLQKKIQKKYFIWLFAGFGMIQVFMNCLMIPLITLTLPLAIYLLYTAKNHRGSATFKTVFKFCVAWAFGYAFSFLTCWIVSAMMMEINVFVFIREALSEFLYRSAGTYDNYSGLNLTLMAMKLNLQLVPAVIVLGLFMAISMVVSLRKDNFKKFLPFLFVSLLPFLWIVILSNHSFVHYPYIRAIFIPTILIWLCLIKYLHSEKQQK